VIDVRESFRDSSELEGKQIGRVFAGCHIRSVVSQLCEKTSIVRTCVIECCNRQSDLRRGRYRTHSR
jgi:hypothetical protein